VCFRACVTCERVCVRAHLYVATDVRFYEAKSCAKLVCDAVCNPSVMGSPVFSYIKAMLTNNWQDLLADIEERLSLYETIRSFDQRYKGRGLSKSRRH
jgi:hypothetical protein